MKPKRKPTRSKSFARPPCQVGEHCVEAGCTELVEIPISRLPTDPWTWYSFYTWVIHGSKPGPTLSLTAAVHGDELNGVEIIRQVVNRIEPDDLSGTILAVPFVNVFSAMTGSRYLPDRRDLNRSFPGSKRGSMASQLANNLMKEVVLKSEFLIDLHCGSAQRTNLPQIRGNLNDDLTRNLALAFNTPTIIHSKNIKGTLRKAATQKGVRVLLYEGGEVLRFNEDAIEFGVTGIMNVLDHLEMLPATTSASTDGKKSEITFESYKTYWVRASRSGIFHFGSSLGKIVAEKETIGFISDVFGMKDHKIKATRSGMIIGHAQDPLVQRGNALVHIALPSGDQERV